MCCGGFFIRLRKPCHPPEFISTHAPRLGHRNIHMKSASFWPSCPKHSFTLCGPIKSKNKVSELVPDWSTHNNKVPTFLRTGQNRQTRFWILSVPVQPSTAFFPVRVKSQNQSVCIRQEKRDLHGAQLHIHHDVSKGQQTSMFGHLTIPDIAYAWFS